MAGREAMVAEMEKLLGLGEYPANSNRNKVTSWYGLVGPWCDMAITYAAYHSGNQDAVCFGGKYAYTVWHAQAFQKHGQWHTDVAGIARGDIVFFDWAYSNNVPAIDHVGIVTGTGLAPDGRFAVYTIEGNIGNVCARKVRFADTIAGFGRPAYAEPPKPKPKPKPKYEPFPGVEFFKKNPNSPIVTAMGKRLVAEKCSRYRVGPGPKWSEADRSSYAAWQRKCGYSGKDADGYPGATSWAKLRVPKV